MESREQPPDMDPMRMQQGLQIPCVDCTVLHQPDSDCPQCGGSGEHFQAAQMCDHSVQWERGQSDREHCDELRKAIAWDELAKAIRGCFVSYMIWGAGWASGYLNMRPDPQDDTWGKWDAVEAAWKALEPGLKAEYHEAKRKGENHERGTEVSAKDII